MKKINSACVKCRREGEKLFLKGEKCSGAKCPFLRRSYPPGQHGARPKKMTDYGKQLREKQKAKRIYGLRETQFKNYYKKAAKMSGDTGELLLSFLERRLDSVVYHLGFASSKRQARQMILHNHFLINKKRVNTPSYILGPKDKIQVVGAKHEKKENKDITLPPWLKLDKSKMEATVLHIPSKEEIESNIDIAQIIEFYSK